MKHQYFGDIRDLFKFDLLQSLSEDLKLSGITYVPMLTEYKENEKNDGNKRKYPKGGPGTENDELLTFVKKYQDIKDRNVSEIKRYFESIGISFNYFGEESEEFKHRERAKYFDKMPSNVNNQLIFFDPDNGLQINKSNHKHIKFDELRKCYNEIDDQSIISVIQFKSREKWKEKTLPNKLLKFKVHDFRHVICIDGQGIAFFIIAKVKERLDKVQISLNNYRSDYLLLESK